MKPLSRIARLLLITSLGFTPFTWADNVQVTLDVKGMTCPLCVTVVNQALRKTDGVLKAKANLKTEQAVVTVADDFNLDRLITAIDATGYKGSINKVEKQS
ncbi:heavy metal transporter [Shewanella sp. BC20]|uniref:heavy-metal-associated domain-containing protein n=1 Tax=Shewanella sp. BC20 TaxID=2004459 RepID=UPI000D6422B9|nr:heavy-metal-associated domain-containing protein [Shewanella sp. BC20]PWF65262.1 heavy metal transporter [Shewanella sp. BC20]